MENNELAEWTPAEVQAMITEYGEEIDAFAFLEPDEIREKGAGSLAEIFVDGYFLLKSEFERLGVMNAIAMASDEERQQYSGFIEGMARIEVLRRADEQMVAEGLSKEERRESLISLVKVALTLRLMKAEQEAGDGS
ncbi:hypothetical protein HY441_00785 [Candidatus Microgenomates bacterium]|nr:hypothetical protein [Candidatus Microgenomates bacterium]